MEPINYYQEMLQYGSYSPSTHHSRDTKAFGFYLEYLIQKAISVFEFDGIPDHWDKSYFLYNLFCQGYIAIIKTEDYGVIPQRCTLTGRNIYMMPSEVIITNALLPTFRQLRIGEQCALIKLMPDYGNIMNICGTYADMLACAEESAMVSLENSKLAYVYFADNKAMAESFKKMFDKISAGEPMVVVDKNLMRADGTKSWDYFTQNIGQNYITDRALSDMRTIMNMFNTEVGLKNANTDKKERLITDEVNANNEETETKVRLWLDSLREGLAKCNEMFGLNISVKYRYEDEMEEAL